MSIATEARTVSDPSRPVRVPLVGTHPHGAGRLGDGRDTSIHREGRMRVKLLSVFPLADAHGPDLDQGALRDLERDRRPIGDGDALRVGDRTAEATFELDDEGLPARLRALRMRDVGGKGILTPFEGAWIVDGARKAYARFDVERFEVNVPEPFE